MAAVQVGSGRVFHALHHNMPENGILTTECGAEFGYHRTSRVRYFSQEEPKCKRCLKIVADRATKAMADHPGDLNADATVQGAGKKPEPLGDHPHTDPGDGRTQCGTCGKFVFPIIHSCKGVRVAKADQSASYTGDLLEAAGYGPGEIQDGRGNVIG